MKTRNGDATTSQTSSPSVTPHRASGLPRSCWWRRHRSVLPAARDSRIVTSTGKSSQQSRKLHFSTNYTAFFLQTAELEINLKPHIATSAAWSLKWKQSLSVAQETAQIRGRWCVYTYGREEMSEAAEVYSFEGWSSVLCFSCAGTLGIMFFPLDRVLESSVWFCLSRSFPKSLETLIFAFLFFLHIKSAFMQKTVSFSILKRRDPKLVVD